MKGEKKGDKKMGVLRCDTLGCRIEIATGNGSLLRLLKSVEG